MKNKGKQLAFTMLVIACIGAALLLFMPVADRQDGVMPPADEIPGIILSESAPADDMADETPDHDSQPLPQVGEWNTYHGDHTLRGVADVAFPNQLTVLWRLAAGAPVRQPPVAHDGRIFAVNARGDVIAASPQGELLWRRELTAVKDKNDAKTSRLRIEAPISAFDGKVFVGTDAGALFALNAETGETAWETTVGGVIRGAANYLPGRNQLIVLDQEDGTLACLDTQTGEINWRSERVDRSDGSPAVSGDIAVFGSCASALHIVATDTGARLRDVPIENGGGQVADGVALFEGFAYAGTRDGRVICAAQNTGEIAWTAEVSVDEVFSTPAVHNDRVIATSHDGFIHALRRDSGALLWRLEIGFMPGSPVIAGDKVFVCADGILHMLRFEDGEQLWKMPLADEIHGPALLPNLLVVGAEDGVVIALGPDNKVD